MKKSAYSFLVNNKDGNLILEYIYSCLKKNQKLDIDDIAQHCFISKSGITRFFQTWGYDGFKEFKYLLLNENAHQDFDNKMSLSEFEYEVMINPIEITAQLNPTSVFETAYQLLKKAGMNYIVGAGGNNSVCLEMTIRLERFGFRTSHSPDFHNMFVLLSNVQKNDLVWVFSYSGETKEIIKLTQFAKKAGAKVIAITREDDNTLTKIANLVFKLDNSENLIRLFSLKSRTAMNYIVYKLTWFIFSKDPQEYNQKLISNIYS